MNLYFKRPVHQLIVTRPLEETKVINEFDVKCHVKGGGLSGQAGAVIHGLSRALVQADPNLKKHSKKTSLQQEIQEKLREKNTVSEKHVEVFSFLKINHLFSLRLKVI